MSLWMLLLVILLTAASVGCYSFGVNAEDPATRRKYYIIAAVLAAALVALVVYGVVRGKWKAKARESNADALGEYDPYYDSSAFDGDAFDDGAAFDGAADGFFSGQFEASAAAASPTQTSGAKGSKSSRAKRAGQVLDTAVLF